MFGFGVLPSVAMFIILVFLYETPRWLVFHGKFEEARKVLMQVQHDDEELCYIVKEYEEMQQNRIGKFEL